MARPRLLTLVVFGIAIAVISTLAEAKSKTIHVTARIVQQTFIGDQPTRSSATGSSATSSCSTRAASSWALAAGRVRSSAFRPWTRS
jgi:hypothetical protein